jgi:NADH:ubiquinone oxidoreductase subunit 6 (subunit J)
VEAVIAFLMRSSFAAPSVPAAPQGFGSPAAIGETLFGAYLLPFEVISILLLAAMVGAIVLTRKPHRP